MMRYHRVSPDCVPLSNGRKHNFRTSKEDDGDGLNEKIPNFSSFRNRSGATSSSSQEYKSPHLVHPDSPHSENHGNPKNQSQSFESSPNNGGDVLLKWGQKKRSRGSRTDNRVVTDESSSLQARQMIKIHKKVGPDKRLMMNNQTANMPPPCAVSSFSRGGNLRPINRNMEERSSLGNKSVVPRSTTEKRSSPSSPEKTEKVVSCSGTASAVEKPNGSLAQVDGVNDVESRGGEKVNMDLFEWPRIYISLSRKEKEDDFLAMKGTKLPQRPKKRAKNIDKTLQYCFPGTWLSDLTRGRYEVREKKCVKKQKRRGLKGMESMESDSE